MLVGLEEPARKCKKAIGEHSNHSYVKNISYRCGLLWKQKWRGMKRERKLKERFLKSITDFYVNFQNKIGSDRGTNDYKIWIYNVFIKEEICLSEMNWIKK